MRCGDGGHATVADRRVGVAERAIADDLEVGRRGRARQVDREPAESGAADAGGPLNDDFEARAGVTEEDGGGADAAEFAEQRTAGTGEAEVSDHRTVAGEGRLESPHDFRQVGGRSDPVEVGIARAAARWRFEDRAGHGEGVAGVDHAVAIEVTGALSRGRGNGEGGESGADEADRESETARATSHGSGYATVRGGFATAISPGNCPFSLRCRTRLYAEVDFLPPHAGRIRENTETAS